jgi:hypothetical protein
MKEFSMLTRERENGQQLLLELMESFAIDGYTTLGDIINSNGVRQFAAVIQDLLQAHNQEMDAE